jgi:hypothetical protein
MRKKLFLISASILLSFFPLAAQTLPSLLVGADAAALGRAETVVAAEADAFSARNHAASMAFSAETVSAGLSYGLWQPSPGRILAFSAGWRPGQRFAVGLSGLRLGLPAYEVTSPNGTVSQINETYSPKEYVFRLSGAYRVLDGLSVGLSAYLCSSFLASDAHAAVPGVDISVSYAGEAFRAGAAVRHLGGKVVYGEGSSAAQPLEIRAGAGYTFMQSLSLLGEADWFPSCGFTGSAALEYAWNGNILVRGGVHYGSGPFVRATYGSLGLGARLKGGRIDAAWVPAGTTMRNTLLVTLACGF